MNNRKINIKKIVLLILVASMFLVSCENLNAPSTPFDVRLTGTWKGSDTLVTTTNSTDSFGYNYEVITTETSSATYTFYNIAEVKIKHSWSKEVKSNGALVSIGGGDGTYTYLWKNFKNSYTLDLTHIESGKIIINGLELTKE